MFFLSLQFVVLKKQCPADISGFMIMIMPRKLLKARFIILKCDEKSPKVTKTKKY